MPEIVLGKRAIFLLEPSRCHQLGVDSCIIVHSLEFLAMEGNHLGRITLECGEVTLDLDQSLERRKLQ